MHKILVIRLYFLLDVLHVSDCVSPPSGATFISCTSHLVYAGICRYVCLLCGYSHTTDRRMVPAYTGVMHGAYNVKYNTIILPNVLHSCETWSVKLTL